MTDPTEAMDAVEKALQDMYFNEHVGYYDCPPCQDNGPLCRDALTHLATLRQQVAELVATNQYKAFAINQAISELEARDYQMAWCTLANIIAAPTPPAADGGQGDDH